MPSCSSAVVDCYDVTDSVGFWPDLIPIYCIGSTLLTLLTKFTLWCIDIIDWPVLTDWYCWYCYWLSIDVFTSSRRAQANCYYYWPIRWTLMVKMTQQYVTFAEQVQPNWVMGGCGWWKTWLIIDYYWPEIVLLLWQWLNPEEAQPLLINPLLWLLWPSQVLQPLLLLLSLTQRCVRCYAASYPVEPGPAGPFPVPRFPARWPHPDPLFCYVRCSIPGCSIVAFDIDRCPVIFSILIFPLTCCVLTLMVWYWRKHYWLWNTRSQWQKIVPVVGYMV